MEGGDNLEQLPEPVITPENNEPDTPVVDDKPQDSTEALTDSMLDDDLVVIPHQNEPVEIEKSEVQQLDIVPSVPPPAAEPDPDPEPVPEQEAQSQPSIPASEPSAPVPPPQQQQPPPPQPNPVPVSRTSAPPKRMAAKPVKAIEDDDEDYEDETLAERLWGLSEMFPQPLRTATGVTVNLSISGLQKLFSFSKSALWIGSTSFMILVLPIVFETEMVHMEQAQIQRQKQILLGPNAATAGGMTGGLTPPMPGIAVAPPPSEIR